MNEQVRATPASPPVAAGRQRPLSDEFSLELGKRTAERLRANPQAVLPLARANLARMRQVHGNAAEYWLRQWEQLLAGDVQHIVTVLTTDDEPSRQLRQNTPFAGVIGDRERQEIIRGLRRRRGAA